MRSTRNFKLAIILLVCTGTASLVACGEGSSSNAPRYGARVSAVPVMTEPAQMTDLRETLTSVGTARALQSVSVYAETSGRVTAVNIEADRSVAAGELLLQLDDRDERLAEHC